VDGIGPGSCTMLGFGCCAKTSGVSCSYVHLPPLLKHTFSHGK